MLLFVGIGCSNHDEPTADDGVIRLSDYSVHFIAGQECVIDILSDVGDLALYSEDPNIATGWWINHGNSILIKGESVGSTSIYIKDRSDPDNLAEIKVVSDYLFGKFKEDAEYANIVVQAYDRQVQEIIKADLRDIARSRSGAQFFFDKEDKIVEIDYSATDYGPDKLVGSYEWTKDSLMLKIGQNSYNCGFAAVNDHSIMIVMDYIKKYKLKYPDAYVMRANLGFFLSAY